jgi:ferrochelatase
MSPLRDLGPFNHGGLPSCGVLLTNVGTPEAPTSSALRKYLAEFLSDPRVIENQGLGWKLILHGLILRTRPARSAAAYKHIWGEDGSPLLAIAQRQAAGVQERLAAAFGNPIKVEIGMGYGSPSMDSGLTRLWEAGCDRVLVFPLYPQYAAATVGSTFDAIAKSLGQTRWVRPLRFISGYHDHSGYISALAASIRDFWKEHQKDQRLLVSFHGLPKESLAKGDPYHCQCLKTARLLWDQLELPLSDRYLGFQSRFGKQVWLQPYTDGILKEWGQAGVEQVDVVCPGFSADCLETLEEIGDEYRSEFLAAGGKDLRYIPALNDRADHLDALAEIITLHLGDWGTPKSNWDGRLFAEEARHRQERADRERQRGING